MQLYKSVLEKLCKDNLSSSWDIFSWRWDNRFEGFMTEFSTDNEDKFRTILEIDFTKVWYDSNIGEAPDIEQVCNDTFGGLQSGQLLFTTDPNQDVFICGAWWPWGDGDTISLRIVPFYDTPPD